MVIIKVDAMQGGGFRVALFHNEWLMVLQYVNTYKEIAPMIEYLMGTQSSIKHLLDATPLRNGQ